MSTLSLLVDSTASTLTVRTRAEGLLARLAHDLEITGPGVTGSATLDGEAWTADLSVPVASLQIVGALHGDTVDTTTLSASDRAQIAQKMREDVFFGGATVVKALASGASQARGEATVSIGSRTERVPVIVTATPRADGTIHATGRLSLSLDKLGVKPIKAPLGAFRVKDAIEIRFAITLAPQPEPSDPTD